MQLLRFALVAAGGTDMYAQVGAERKCLLEYYNAQLDPGPQMKAGAQ
jgi:hypothetical protein